MSSDADLYKSRMELGRYWAEEACGLCRVGSFAEFLERLRRGEFKAGGCGAAAPLVEGYMLTLQVAELLPPVPMLNLPRPVEAGLIEFNEPDEAAPLLVTGNSELTRDVLLTVLSFSRRPLRLLMADVRGHTVDMAVVFGEFTAARVETAFRESGVHPSDPRRVVLPGLAGKMAAELSGRLGRPVETGPVCAAEIPLFLGQDFLRQ